MNRRIEIRVSAADGLSYWLAIDDHDLTVVNGSSSIDLDDQAEHVLLWWMVGEPGNVLSIVGTDGARVVVAVKESKIPDGSNMGAGYRKFRIQS